MAETSNSNQVISELKADNHLLRNEIKQAAEYGLAVIAEKEQLQQHYEKQYEELDDLYDTAKRELSCALDALNKVQKSNREGNKIGVDQEESLLRESASREAELLKEISDLTTDLKNSKNTVEHLEMEFQKNRNAVSEIQTNLDASEVHNKKLRKDKKELKSREAKNMSDYAELEDENVALHKQLLHLKQTVVDYEATKLDNRCLKTDLEDARSEKDELLGLKKILENNLEEMIQTLKLEREQKRALKNELEQHLSTISLYKLQNLAGLGLDELETEETNVSIHDDVDNPSLKRVEADVVLSSNGMIGDLFSEIHVTELRKLEEMLENSESEKMELQKSLEDYEKRLEMMKSELERHLPNGDANKQVFEKSTETLRGIEWDANQLREKLIRVSNDLEKVLRSVRDKTYSQDSESSCPTPSQTNGSKDDKSSLNSETESDLSYQNSSRASNSDQTENEDVKCVDVTPIYIKPIDVEAVNVTPTDVTPIDFTPIVDVKFVDFTSVDVNSVDFKDIGVTAVDVKPDTVKAIDVTAVDVKPDTVKAIGVTAVDVKPDTVKVIDVTAVDVKPDTVKVVDVTTVDSNDISETICDQVMRLSSSIKILLNRKTRKFSASSDDSSDLHEEILKLRLMIGAKNEKIQTLRAIIKENKMVATTSLTALKQRYQDERTIVAENMQHQRNELKTLKENAAEFISLRAAYAQRCDEYLQQVEEKHNQLTAAEDEKKTLNSLLRNVIQQKVKLTQRLEDVEFEYEAKSLAQQRTMSMTTINTTPTTTKSLTTRKKSLFSR